MGPPITNKVLEAEMAVKVENLFYMCRAWPDGRIVKIEVTPRVKGAEGKRKDFTTFVKELAELSNPSKAKQQLMMEFVKGGPYNVDANFPKDDPSTKSAVGDDAAAERKVYYVEVLNLLKGVRETAAQENKARASSAHGWTAQWQKEHTCFYYTNVRTAEQSWELPACLNDRPKPVMAVMAVPVGSATLLRPAMSSSSMSMRLPQQQQSRVATAPSVGARIPMAMATRPMARQPIAMVPRPRTHGMLAPMMVQAVPMAMVRPRVASQWVRYGTPGGGRPAPQPQQYRGASPGFNSRPMMRY